MIRKSVAGVILGISLLVGSLAWAGFVALRTVFDPDQSATVAEELLDNDEVSEQLAINVANAISSLIPPEVPITNEVIAELTVRVLEDPAVEAVILDAFVDTHRAFLGEGDTPEVIDLTPVALAARDTLVEQAPQLDSLLSETPSLIVPLPTEHVPDAGPVRRFTQAAVPILALASIGGALLALFATTDRPAILRRAARWALTTTAIYLIIGFGVPALLRELAPDQAEVVAALLSALLRSVLIPSIVLGAVGVGLLLASMAWSSISKSAADRAVDRKVQAAAVAPVPRRAAPSKSGAPRASPQAPAPRAPQQGQPGVAAGITPSSSPYPDDPYQRDRAAQDWTTTEPPRSAPAAGGPGGAETNASVFADVPLPQDATPPQPTPLTQAPTPSANVEMPPSSSGERSVFPDREQASSSSPPAGARWSNDHGWVLDPDSSDPLPAGAVWLDGVGYVLPKS